MKSKIDRIVEIYFAGGDWKDAIKKYTESNFEYYKRLIQYSAIK